MLKLTLSDLPLEVVLLRRVRKSIGIRIIEGRVEISAHPRVSLAYLQRLLEQKRDWIELHWRRQTVRPPLTQVWLAGQALDLLPVVSLTPWVLLTEQGLQVAGDPARLKQQVADFLRQEAVLRFPLHLSALASAAVRLPQRLALSGARTRWGSCSHQDVIRLNWRLVQAPPEVLDYVIAHELAHLRHMNHSAAFWEETARLYPSWKPARRWLKQHGRDLFDFG